MAQVKLKTAAVMTAVLSLFFTSPHSYSAPYQEVSLDNTRYRIFSDGHYRVVHRDLLVLHRTIGQAHIYIFNRYQVPLPPSAEVAVTTSSAIFRDITGQSHLIGGLYLPAKRRFCFYIPGAIANLQIFHKTVYHEVMRRFIYRVRRGEEIYGREWMEEAFCEARFPLYARTEESKKKIKSLQSCREFRKTIRYALKSPEFKTYREGVILAGLWGSWNIDAYGEKFLLERIIRGTLTPWMSRACENFLKTGGRRASKKASLDKNR